MHEAAHDGDGEGMTGIRQLSPPSMYATPPARPINIHHIYCASTVSQLAIHVVS